MNVKTLHGFLPPKYSIRTRLILLFLIAIVVIFAIAGYYLQWQIRATLDDSLGKNLETLAATIALQVDPFFLAQIQPGDENTRTYRNIKNLLLRFQRVSGVNRVFIFGRDLTSIVDSDSLIYIGQTYNQLRVNRKETERVFQGFTVSSTLFKGVDGNLYKTGYAPIMSDETVVAALAVAGSAEMLQAVTTIQKNLLGLSLLIILGAILLGSLFADRITTPLKKLEVAANKISSGNLHSQIPDCGKDEVGFLAATMEQMRKSILERDKRQQAMLAGVAHEIRNPLGGIELFSGLLANDLENEELKNYAQKISKEVGNLKTIIQDFLDYARPSPANRTPTKIKPIFDEAILFSTKEIDEINIEYDESEKGLSVYADPQHLKQIFLNLIKNSVQAISGDGTIFVKVQRTNGNVEIIFADSGPGIADEVAERIFEPFFTTREHGTGLGLAVVKNLVQENGGSIRYVRAEKGGAHFLIELPGRKEIFPTD